MQGVKTVAICLAGEARTLRTDASIRRLLQQNFLAEASYSLFLSLEDATTAKDVAALLQNSSGGGGMTATISSSDGLLGDRGQKTPTATPCLHELYGFDVALRTRRLIPMAMKIAGCADLIERAGPFDLIVRSRPDLRFTRRIPHVAELLAEGDGSGALLWDDQFMIAPYAEGLQMMRAAPLVYASCPSSNDWSLACNKKVDDPILGGVPCPPMMLVGQYIRRSSHPPLKQCGFVWSEGCGLRGVDLPPRWPRFEPPPAEACTFGVEQQQQLARRRRRWQRLNEQQRTASQGNTGLYAAQWLSHSANGYCAVSLAGGDCECGEKGSWSIPHQSAQSWPAAVAFCAGKCATCARCAHMSVSLVHRDCSWFTSCNHDGLLRDVKGFRSATFALPPPAPAAAAMATVAALPSSAHAGVGLSSSSPASSATPPSSDTEVLMTDDATAAAWLGESRFGSCGVTTTGDHGDCLHGDRGSWHLDENVRPTHASWILAAQDCLSRCRACARCSFVSITLWDGDCSWYHSCDLSALHATVPGTRSAAIPRAKTARDALPPPLSQTKTPRARSNLVNAAVALQVSGHLHSRCRTRQLRMHATACRARFARCDVYLHTWNELTPKTVHWSGRSRAPPISSNACVAQLAFDPHLKVSAVAREAQPSWDGNVSALAPDGMPFLDEGLRWGPERHHGWMANVAGMRAAGRMRREATQPPPGSYNLSMRLRPDGKEISGFTSMTPRQVEDLWACVAASARLGVARWRDPVVPCTPTSLYGMGNFGNDNCLFGAPAALDALLEQIVLRQEQTYRHVKRLGLSNARPEMQFTAAAALLRGDRAGHRTRHPGMSAVVAIASKAKGRLADALQRKRCQFASCHLDDQRMLMPVVPNDAGAAAAGDGAAAAAACAHQMH